MPSQLTKTTKNGAGNSSSGKRLTTKMASIGVVLGCARSAAAFSGVAIRSSSSSSVAAASARFPRTSSAAAAASTFVSTSRYGHQKSFALAGTGTVGINRIGSSLFSTAAAEDTAAASAATGHDVNYDQTNKAAGIIGKYDPEAFESSIYKWWENEGCFQPDAKRSRVKAEAEDKKPYVLPMPPPNVTGRLHMGHAIFVALQDVLARFHRMRGRPVLWLPGALFYMSLCVVFWFWRRT